MVLVRNTLSLAATITPLCYNQTMTDISASAHIDDIIQQYNDWRNATLKRLRAIIRDTDPELVEEVKWKMKTNPLGLPVWSRAGIVCYVQTFKNDIKLVFAQGPHLEDPKHLFNARLQSVTRAIEFHEGDPIDEAGLRALIVEAVNYNTAKIPR